MTEESYLNSLGIIPFIFHGYYFSYMYTLEFKIHFHFRITGLIPLGTIFSAIINIILNIIFISK